MSHSFNCFIFCGLVLFLFLINVKSSKTVGGWQKVPSTDPHVVELSHHSASLVNEQKNEDFYMVLESIVEAEVQVVAGLKYRLKILLAKTNCRKTTLYEQSHMCEIDTSKSKSLCTVEYWEKPWQNKRHLLSLICVPM